MTATFDPALADDKDTMRLTVGDTDTDAAYLQDETYEALLTVHGTIVLATLAAFDAILSLLAVPDIYADWYREFNHEKAYASLKQRREDFANANGAGRLVSRGVAVYRGDSNMTEGLV